MKGFYIIVFVLIPFLSAAQNEVDIVNRYLDSIGGIENWRQLKTKIEENQSRYLEIKKNTTAENDIGQAKFYKSKEYVQYNPFKRVKEVYRNDKIYTQIFCQGERMFFKYPNMDAEESYETCDTELHPLEIFELLNDSDGDYLEYAGRKTIGEQEYDVVKAYYTEFTLNEYFNIETGLRDFSFSPEDSTRYTAYEDYRQIGKLKIPFKYHSVTGGIRFFEFEVLSVELDANIPLEKFEIPKKP